MRIKAGVICLVLGTVLIISALLLYMCNNNEENTAAKASEEALYEIVEVIKAQTDKTTEDIEEMPAVDIEGNRYIGYIYIPTLEDLELPVTSDWSYDLLKRSPCRYSGSILSDDMVLLGHNYTVHFGKLSRLVSGDKVYFTDMRGALHTYEVIGIDVLKDTAIEDMTSGEYDLSLFTCDYSGRNRLTVRCDRVI